MPDEVRKCTYPGCQTRVNWEWMQGVITSGSWHKRCTKDYCQTLDAWETVVDEPPP